MNLRDELPPLRGRGAKCNVALLLAELEPAVAAELRTLMDDHRVASSQLADLALLKKWNLKYDSIKRHRRKACQCH